MATRRWWRAWSRPSTAAPTTAGWPSWPARRSATTAAGRRCAGTTARSPPPSLGCSTRRSPTTRWWRSTSACSTASRSPARWGRAATCTSGCCRDAPHSFEIAARRLPLLPFEPAGAEAIAVWQADEHAPSAKRLSALGDLRGCPVVRLANGGDRGQGWPEMVLRCLSGIGELCELAR